MASKLNSTGFRLKDQLFNREKVQSLARQLHCADAQFDAAGFVRQVMRPFESMELKERIVHISTVLESYLDNDFVCASDHIVASLPQPLDPTKTDDDFGDFILAPYGEFVVRNGLAKRHVKRSLRTLKSITQRFSMEDAIRAFINQHPQKTLAELGKWSSDSNYHVRRLVSEGTRPVLPWSKRLTIPPTQPLPLLETLHADSTRYVTRSVANHLNDLSKSDPPLVIETLQRWKRLGLQDPQELEWMTRHALRTLVKQGNQNALRVLGFRSNPQVEVSDFSIDTPIVRPGASIEFSFTVLAQRNEALMIDYVVQFVKANGSLAPKVYKLKQLKLGKGTSARLGKRHPLRADATTYTLYPGTHHVTLQVNGKPHANGSFELVLP